MLEMIDNQTDPILATVPWLADGFTTSWLCAHKTEQQNLRIQPIPLPTKPWICLIRTAIFRGESPQMPWQRKQDISCRYHLLPNEWKMDSIWIQQRERAQGDIMKHFVKINYITSARRIELSLTRKALCALQRPTGHQYSQDSNTLFICT